MKPHIFKDEGMWRVGYDDSMYSFETFEYCCAMAKWLWVHYEPVRVELKGMTFRMIHA